MKGRIFVYVALILAMVCWSFSFIWGEVALKTYNPITVVFFRLAISSVLLLVIISSIGKLQKIAKGDFKIFMLLTFFEPFMYFLGEAFGLKLVSSTIASVIISTIPLFVPFIALLLFKERISLLNMLGIVVSIVGVVLVILNKNLSLSASPEGVALMFLAVISAVGYTMVLRHLSTKYNAFSIITYQNVIGTIAFAPLFFIFDYNHFLSVGLVTDVIIIIVELAVFASTLAFIFFTYGVQKIGVNKASIFTNAIPVITAVLAYFILGQELTNQKVVGISIVILGLFVSQVKSLSFVTKRQKA